MLCIEAREKNKIKLLWLCFDQVKRKKAVAGGDREGHWKYDVKMPNGENYVWVRKQKRLQDYLCADGVRGHLVALQSSGHRGSVHVRVCGCVFVRERWHVAPNIHKSISVDVVPNGQWLQVQGSVDWQRRWWTTHSLLQRWAFYRPRWIEALEVTVDVMKNHLEKKIQ